MGSETLATKASSEMVSQGTPRRFSGIAASAVHVAAPEDPFEAMLMSDPEAKIECRYDKG